MATEAFAKIEIDQLLRHADWTLTDGRSVRFEYPLDNGGKADDAPVDRQGRALAVLETKSTSVYLSAGEAQGQRYDDVLRAPFIFISNGKEVWFRDKTHDAHTRRVQTVFMQESLVRRKASCEIRRNPFDIAIETRIAGGGGRVHQAACIDVKCRKVAAGRRKLLADMPRYTAVYHP